MVYNNTMKAIRHYNHEPEAVLAQQFLQENGIEATLSGGTLTHAHPATAVLDGGTSVWVDEENVAKADELLKATHVVTPEAHAYTSNRLNKLGWWFIFGIIGVPLVLALIFHYGTILTGKLFFWVENRNYSMIFLGFLGIEMVRYLMYRLTIK